MGGFPDVWVLDVWASPDRERIMPARATEERGAMSEPRVKAGLWVSMALRMADLAGRPGAVLRRGDPDAGGVLAVLRGREGLCVLSQMRTAEGALAWMRGTGPAPVDQAAADAYVARQMKFDPDLWVVEFEAPDLLPPFEARIM
jgi:hypothetical protein